MKKAEYQEHLQEVLENLRKALGLSVEDRFDTAIVLGTGWGDHLRFKALKSVKLVEVDGFHELDELDGHERCLEIWEVENPNAESDGPATKRILALRGRIHMNEDTFNPAVRLMVRMQVELLHQLGVEKLVLTCSLGATIPQLIDGDIITIDKFLAFGSGEVMPLFPDEFIAPSAALDSTWINSCRDPKFHEQTGIRFMVGPHMFWCGSHFETTEDKEQMRKLGALGVGMSVKPECAVAALCDGMEVIALGFISNSMLEVPEHGLHKRRAKKHSAKLAKVALLAIWH